MHRLNRIMNPIPPPGGSSPLPEPYRFTVAALVFVLLCSCEFPYSPRYEPSPSVTDHGNEQSRGSTGSGVLYPVNIGQQSCNPSVAPGGILNGCMLFLGFDRLAVSAPVSPEWTDRITTHDRLIIVDTANSVRWFLMRDAVDLSEIELQCPEWSTASDYLTCLAGRIGRKYSGYAVRLSDRRTLKIADAVLGEFSTPHLWLKPNETTQPASAPDTEITYNENGFADPSAVGRFFATDSVKFIYTLPSGTGTLRFVDYCAGGSPVPQQLAKPVGKENWYCESPLISPDGNWVAYHCFSNPTKGPLYASYIQHLDSKSEPVLIAEGASDPHWWTDPFTGDYHVIYTVTYGDYFTGYDLADAEVERRHVAGCTVKMRLKGTWHDVPAHIGTLQPDTAVAPDTLVHLPFKGGLSRDGRFLATAYAYSYLANLY